PLPQPQNVLFAAAFDPQRYHKHLPADLDSIDQQRHQIQLVKLSLAQLLQLPRAGLHELPAHAALLDAVAIQHRFHRSVIVPRRQPGHDAFPHRSLPPPVVLRSYPTLLLRLRACAPAAGGSTPSALQTPHNLADAPNAHNWTPDPVGAVDLLAARLPLPESCR